MQKRVTTLRHIFIINPHAGKQDSRQHIYDMADALREEHGLAVECILTTSPGNATVVAREIAESGEEVRFYACGGDGTVNEVANGIAGFPNAAMTCIPIGTGNDFLKNFGSDVYEQFLDARCIFDGEVQELDLIDCNGRQCLTIACCGLDARIAADVHKFGTSHVVSGMGAYIAALAANFVFKSLARHWTVELDGEVREGDFAIVTVCNGRYYGGGFMPMAEASMTDGVLNTLVIKKVSRPVFLRFVGPYSKGGYRQFPDYATAYTAKEITIRSAKRDVTVCLDGETMETDCAHIRLSDKKLRFFGPRGCSPDATRRQDASFAAEEENALCAQS